MIIKRHFDWAGRLEVYLKEVQENPFKWGEFDCALFLCGCGEAMTGFNLAEDFIGKYETAEGAHKQIKKFCENSEASILDLCKKMAKKHGFEKVSVNFAQRGDAVLVDVSETETVNYALGIVDLNGREVLLVHFEKGLTRFPLSSAEHAWRIG